MLKKISRKTWMIILGVVTTLVVIILSIVSLLPSTLQNVNYSQLYDGRLVAADYWSPQPKILSAGLGFDGIIGLPSLDEQTVRAAGGAYRICS